MNYLWKSKILSIEDVLCTAINLTNGGQCMSKLVFIFFTHRFALISDIYPYVRQPIPDSFPPHYVYGEALYHHIQICLQTRVGQICQVSCSSYLHHFISAHIFLFIHISECQWYERRRCLTTIWNTLEKIQIYVQLFKWCM